MKMRLFRLTLIAIALLTICVPLANATAYLWLTAGLNTVVVADFNTGMATFNGALGGFTYNVVTGFTKPILGNTNLPQLDLSSVNVTSSSAGGTITIRWSDVDFGPLIPSYYYFLLNIGGTSQGTLTYQTYMDTGNALFGTTTPMTSMSFPSGAFSGSASYVPLTPPQYPFSLTQIVTLTLGPGQVASFNAGLETVPEPSALLLLGSGLAALGFWRLKKRG